MTIKLSYKFFIAFLLTSVISVVLMIVIMHFYLSRNFIAFINQMDMEILNELNNTLSVEYQTHQGWDRLKKNKRQFWHRLLHSASSKHRHFDKFSPPPLSFFRPPANVERGNFDNPSPSPDLKRSDEEEQHPRQQHLGPRPFHRIALFDAQKHLIIGNTSPFKQHLTRIIIVEGKQVGWVGIQKIKHLSKHRENQFLKRQANAFYLAGICILFMTTLIAWWLSKHLLTPIKQLIEGTQALTSRQFNTKIKVHSTDELGLLADNFNMMAQTLEKYEIMRKQWLSDISHELRTPLAIMRGEIEAMQDGIRNFDRGALDSLHSEVQRLSRIVDDLRKSSAAETETMSFKKEPIKPFLILRETLKWFQTRLAQHHIQVQDNLPVDDYIILQGDADRLTQLFSNLLENTLRYVDSPGTLKIWSEHREAQLILNFVDSGPGVPEESLWRLFDRLYRVEQSRNRTKGGSGLGLAICKNIVEMHGGEITATNAPSSGLWIKIVFRNDSALKLQG